MQTVPHRHAVICIPIVCFYDITCEVDNNLKRYNLAKYTDNAIKISLNDITKAIDVIGKNRKNYLLSAIYTNYFVELATDTNS